MNEKYQVAGSLMECLGDSLFWERLSGMPFSEAEPLLLKKKAELLLEHSHRSAEGRKNGYTDATCMDIQNTAIVWITNPKKK